MKLTDPEKGWLAVMRLNKRIPRDEISMKRRIGRLKLGFEWRSAKNLWGRFGGGWNWKLGFQSGGKSIILYFLVFSISIAWSQEARP